MGQWLAALGPVDAATIRAVLGADAELHLGSRLPHPEGLSSRAERGISFSSRAEIPRSARDDSGGVVASAALGVRQNGGDPALLVRHPDGAVEARLGCPEEGGCSATLAADGGSLTLRRDPFGLHGVYHTRIGGTVWSASDPRLLAALPGACHSLDLAALHGYLCFSYVPVAKTLTLGVHAVPAGATLMLAGDGARIDEPTLWREDSSASFGFITDETAPRPFVVTASAVRGAGRSDVRHDVASPHYQAAPDEDAAVCELRRLLREAVARRLAGVREAAVYLSGGLDSSLIAAMLVRAGVSVRLFTLDFGAPFNDEVDSARLVARHLGLPLQLVPAGAREVRAALDATAAALHQPFGDAVTVPLFLLGRAARGVDAVFNGEGGDQLFGGWTNKPMMAAEVYGAADYDREAAYMATFHRFHGLTDTLYTERACTLTAGLDAVAWVRPALDAPGFRSLLHRLRAANLRLKGAQNIAPRAVQLAAAHGLPMRMPFFDRALTDWTFRLPPEWFLSGAREKYLLKRAAEPLLPPAIVWREKRGMGVPVTEWLRGPLRREAGRRLSESRLRHDRLFEPEAVKALLRGDDHAGEIRRRRLGERLWTLLMLEVWRTRQGMPAKRQGSDLTSLSSRAARGISWFQRRDPSRRSG